MWNAGRNLTGGECHQASCWVEFQQVLACYRIQLRLPLSTSGPSGHLLPGRRQGGYAAKRTINSNFLTIYYNRTIANSQRKSLAGGNFIKIVQFCLTSALPEGKIYAVWCTLPGFGPWLCFIDNRLKPGFRDLRHMAFDLHFYCRVYFPVSFTANFTHGHLIAPTPSAITISKRRRCVAKIWI